MGHWRCIDTERSIAALADLNVSSTNTIHDIAWGCKHMHIKEEFPCAWSKLSNSRSTHNPAYLLFNMQFSTSFAEVYELSEVFDYCSKITHIPLMLIIAVFQTHTSAICIEGYVPLHWLNSWNPSVRGFLFKHRLANARTKLASRTRPSTDTSKTLVFTIENTVLVQ